MNAEPNYTYSELLLLLERYSRFKVTRMLKKFFFGGGEVLYNFDPFIESFLGL